MGKALKLCFLNFLFNKSLDFFVLQKNWDHFDTEKNHLVLNVFICFWHLRLLVKISQKQIDFVSMGVQGCKVYEISTKTMTSLILQI